MPISILELTDERRTVSVTEPWDVTITYRPNQLTPAAEMAILRAATTKGSDDDDENDELLLTAERNIQRQVRSFMEIVESWDVTGPLAEKEGQRFDFPFGFAGDFYAYAAEHGATLLVEPGHVVPIDETHLPLMGSFVLTELIRIINEDMRPSKGRKRR